MPKVKVPEGYNIYGVPANSKPGEGSRLLQAGEIVEMDQFSLDCDPFLADHALDAAEGKSVNPYKAATAESLKAALKKRDLEHDDTRKGMADVALKNNIPIKELAFATTDGKAPK